MSFINEANSAIKCRHVQFDFRRRIASFRLKIYSGVQQEVRVVA